MKQHDFLDAADDANVAGSALPFLPDVLTYPALCAAAESCRGCELYRHATHVVFGDGATHGKIMLVGEQPGNDEDLAGKPFVGPAGKFLARAMAEAGVRREDVYVTNAVKHFRFEAHGGRRIHKTPLARHINACKPWLQAEIELVKPQVIVTLGATAAKSLFGNNFSLTQSRGEPFSGPDGLRLLATYHPSAGLRAPDPAAREKIYRAITEDLVKARGMLSA